MTTSDFERLLDEAERARFSGWDFSWLQGRLIEEPASWDFTRIARGRLRGVRSLLDLGTGGGEFLSSLAPLPRITWATECYRPNQSIAARHLGPLGAAVIGVEPAPDNDEWEGAGGLLPFRDECFDLVISRHEAYSPTEVSRILKRGGDS